MPLVELKAQEHLVSEAWATSTGTQHFFKKNSTKSDGSGNIYVVGSTINTSGDYDILIEKLSPSGLRQWVQQYSGPSGKDAFSMALFISDSGNVYVTGCVNASTIDSNNIITLKYNSLGALLWSAEYNGPGSSNDIGTDLTVNDIGTVFVCGGTYNSSSKTDFVTLCYASNGSLTWSQTWNNLDLHDAANKIAYDDLAGAVYAAGGTQTSGAEWQYAVIGYSESTGSYIGSNISGGSGVGIDQVNDIIADNFGNIYLTGGVINLTTGLDCRTIKLDSTLSVVWYSTFNGEDDLDDAANSITIDDSGYVYITGYSTSTNESKAYVTIKYDPSGQEKWVIHYNGSNSQDDEATAILLDEDRNIIVTGSCFNGSDQDYVTVKYSNDGSILWGINYNHSYGGNDKANAIALDNQNNIIVTGQCQSGSSTLQYVTVKYAQLTHDLIIQYDTLDNPLYPKNELIIRFDPTLINTAAIDNKAKRFGPLSDFVDSAFLNRMNQKTETDFSSKIAIKIYTNMTTADTITTSRLGRILKVPKFWAAFRVVIPDNLFSSALFDSLNDRDTTDGLFPSIRYAEPNWILTLHSVTPNDPHYDDKQIGLHPNTNYPLYTNGHINAEGAWSMGAFGSPDVRIGIFDTGIRHDHPDFSLDGTTNNLNSLSNTKIKGGRDYSISGYPPVTSQSAEIDLIGHGTAVAGICGAIRNNGIGVAGVAGGDMNDNNNPGASLYNMKIWANQTSARSITCLTPAILDAVLGSGANGYVNKLDIANYSWGYDSDVIPPLTPVFHNELKMNIRFAFENELIQVCARGNRLTDLPNYPSSYYEDWQIGDDWLISVGGSTNDGDRHGESNYGIHLDVVAPYYEGMVYTTANSPGAYRTFNGTSSSAPHVSGVAALIMSYHNEKLAPEDIERLIEYSASDRNSSGYDVYTGWGLLNAGSAIQLIEFPHYRVVHYEVQPTNPINITNNVFVDNMVSDYDSYPMGPITVDVYKYTATVSHTGLGPNAQIVSSANKPGYWIRNSGSNLWGPIIGTTGNKQLLPETDVKFDGTPSISSATVVGYYYKLSTVPNTPIIPHNADPYSLIPPVMAYSLLIYDPDYTTVNKLNRVPLCNIYPNPAANNVAIQYWPAFDQNPVYIILMDLQGRVIKSINLGPKTKGEHIFQMDMEGVAAGMYLLNIKIGTSNFVKKIIKN